MAKLKIWLLGRFQTELDGRLISNFRSDKVRALLAFLLLESEHPWSREYLSDLFWPNYVERKARSNLRNALWNLRSEIGEFEPGKPFIIVEKSKIQFNPSAELWMDVDVFYDLVNRICTDTDQPIGEEFIQKIKEALFKFQGSFIEGIFVDSPAFETWMEKINFQVRQKRVQALKYISKFFYLAGNLEKAQPWVQKWIELDPWEEEAYRLSMSILGELGRRNHAISQFRKCQNRLIDDLGVEPQSETVLLYERISHDQEIENFFSKEIISADFPMDYINLENLPKNFTKAIMEGQEPKRFFARSEELKKLNAWLSDVIKGNGRAGFLIGETGCGKTFLMTEFIRHALEKYSDLLVFQGQCNAYVGRGDSYCPFLNIIRMMGGELTSITPSAFANLEHAERLYKFLPDTLYCLLDYGHGLIQRFLNMNHWISSVMGNPNLTWDFKKACFNRIQRYLSKPKKQISVNDQFTQVMNCLSKKHPILMSIDDLQWIDEDSASLLFHLRKQILNKRIFLLGAFRSEEVGDFQEQGHHPLIDVFREFQTIFGDITIDLLKANGKVFIYELLSSEPNELSKEFRELLFHHTSGNPLFTIELLRSMQIRNEIVQNDQGRWVEGDHLDWEILPVRLRAVVARRINMLPKECFPLLSIASVQGEIFNLEVISLVSGKSEVEAFTLLNDYVRKRHQLIIEEGVRFIGQSPITSFKFRHKMFQVFLYNQLTHVEKLRFHNQVGLAIEKLYQHQIAQYPEVAYNLARHFVFSNKMEKAAKYFNLAEKNVGHNQ